MTNWQPPEGPVPPSSSWPPPQQQFAPPPAYSPQQSGPPAYSPQQSAPSPAYWPQQTPAETKLMEWTLPINRSGLAIAAGYVALCSFPIVFLGPIALTLGILALFDLKKNVFKLGRGRAWFAVVYGAITTGMFAYLLVLLVLAPR